MSNKKISEDALLAAGSIDGDADYIPVVDVSEASAGSRNKRSLLKSIADWVVQSAASFLQSGTGAIAEAVQEVLRRDVWVMSYIPAALRAGVVARTNTTDLTSYVQAAINFALLTGRRLKWSTGTYKIDSTLFVYTASTFISLRMEGEHCGGLTNSGTIIDHSANATTPLFAIQGTRAFYSDGISYLGPNDFTTTDWFDEADFTKSGVRDSQYSPQCAICIDPFKNGVPSDGGYPGLSAYYTSAALASSRATLKNGWMVNQLVGIMVSPSGEEANAENLEFDNFQIENTKVPVALGQLHIKGITISNLFCDKVWCALDTYSYGAQNGSAGFQWLGGDVSRSNMLLKTLSQAGASNSITHNWSVNGVYAESIWRIGFIGDVSTAIYHPGAFNQCTFWMTTDDTQRKDAQLTNFAPLTFNNCQIYATGTDTTTTRALKFYHRSAADEGERRLLQFNNCKFMGDWAILFNSDQLHNVRMNGCTTVSPFFRTSFSDLYRIDSLANLTFYNPVWPGALIDDADSGALLKVAQGMNSVALGTLTFTKGGFTGTFTAADDDTLQVFDTIYVAAQDIEKIDGTTFSATNWPLGVVSAMDGADITIRDVSENAASGSLALSLKWYGLLHGPSTIDLVDTSADVVITQTGNANAWQTGNRVSAAGGIPAGAYIVSGTAPNFVLSKAATVTGSGRIWDANCSVITKADF